MLNDGGSYGRKYRRTNGHTGGQTQKWLWKRLTNIERKGEFSASSRGEKNRGGNDSP